MSGPRPPVTVAVDAMGADRGPAVVVAGMARAARRDPGLRFLVHGDSAELTRLLGRRRALKDRVELRHADKAVDQTQAPGTAVRTGRGSSMWNALMAVRDGDAAVAVSCGNTGALVVMSRMTVKRAPAVARICIAVLWPADNDRRFNVLLDAGADLEATPEDLATYAVMGAAYARHALTVTTPRVGLLNVGTESHKGHPELHEADALIAAAADAGGYSYVGFVEGTDIPVDTVDVVVTDGFTGNIAVKTAEGTAKLVKDLLRQAFRHSIFSRIGALFALTSLQRLGRRIDPRRVNGGVILGLNGTVIKSHGGADPIGMAAALELAAALGRAGFGKRVADRVASARTGDQAAREQAERAAE